MSLPHIRHTEEVVGYAPRANLGAPQPNVITLRREANEIGRHIPLNSHAHLVDVGGLLWAQYPG
eukprot:6296604-Pyramimonas_sp.AAC.3